jgi:hypothetical protein
MKLIKGYSDAMIPAAILIGLFGVEFDSAATKIIGVGTLVVIGVIQTICYATNKTN